MNPILKLEGITKRFGSLVANDGISLSLNAGEVLALLGENGAGKSTLVSILFGHYMADAGSIEVFGQPLAPGQPKASLNAGIGMVHQHFSLAENLTVLDNILLGTEPLLSVLSNRAAARAKLDDLARRFGLAVEASAKVSTLSVGEKQRVEILKALYRGARILILDEPTAVLTPQEAESLFHTLRQLVAQGLAVIFISHKLGEVLAVSDHVAVLRGGKLVVQCPAKDVTKEALATLMVGRQVEMPRRDERPHAGPVRLLVKNAFTERAQGRSGLQDLFLVVRSGEIVAVAGVAGNGQDILAGVLSGLIPLERGTVAVEDQPLPSNPRAWIQANVGRVPEDRQGVGSIGDMSVWENAILERYGEKRFSRAGMISRPAAREHAQSLVGHYDVRISHIDAPMRSLSGGNIQKLLLGRVLSEKPRLLVVNQPTWGLDIGAVAFIHAQLLEARKEGAAIVLISEDLDEIFALADRIAVMHAGRLSEARLTAQWTMSGIGLAMAGAA